MKFRIVGLCLLLSFLFVGQNNLTAQSCQKICASKSEAKADNQTNVLAVSMESESSEKKCSKPCTKVAEANSESPQAVLASQSEVKPDEAKKCIKTCKKIAESSASTAKAVLATYIGKSEADSKSCDPRNCDPKDCEPKNCDPSQCASVDKSKNSNFSFLSNIFKANPDCKPAVKDEAQTVSAKL